MSVRRRRIEALGQNGFGTTDSIWHLFPPQINTIAFRKCSVFLGSQPAGVAAR